MFEKLNGTEIVATITGGQPYWRLGAAEVQRWVASLPPSATQDNVSRVEWVGDAWDGSSDIYIGEDSCGRKMNAFAITSLLRKLRSGIRTLEIDQIVPPEASSIRSCRVASNSVLIVDFDLVDFIIPIAIDGSRTIGQRGPSVAAIATQMLEFVKGADTIRFDIANRETGMRRVLEETAAEIGHAAAPLWMRLCHVPYYDDAKYLPEMGYVVLLATINQDLVWAPSGTERIETVLEVRAHRDYYARDHSERAAILEDRRATKSAGAISETALAFIASKGLDAGETFDAVVASAMARRGGGLHFERGKTTEALYHHNGVVIISLNFPGGSYYRDCLTLRGDYPLSVANQAEGKQLGEFVEHPAFSCDGLVIVKAEVREGALELHHAPRNVPIERHRQRDAEIAKAA